MSLLTINLGKIGVVASCVAWAGCSSPQRTVDAQATHLKAPRAVAPTVGTPMQDVWTEAKVQEIELWYEAAKNSRSTHQHEAEAEAAEKARAKEADAAKANAAAEKRRP